MTDQGLAGFVPWKYLWSQMNAPMVTISYAPVSHWQRHDLKCLSVMGLRASLTGRGQRKGETVEERRENLSFHPSCPFRGLRKFDMVDLNTFSIISKQEVSPAAVFQPGRGCSCPHCDGQMLPTMFAFDFWPEKQKLTLQMSCDIFQIGLTFHSWPRGFLVCPL